MQIRDILNKNLIVPDVAGSDKEAVLRVLAEHLSRNCDEINAGADHILSALLGRERLGSTGVGEGVAIPHAKIPGLSSLLACFGRVPAGVKFDAIDEQPVTLIFVLLVPENSAGAHLKALARISRLLKQQSFRDELMALPDAPSIYEAFISEDGKL